MHKQSASETKDHDETERATDGLQSEKSMSESHGALACLIILLGALLDNP